MRAIALVQIIAQPGQMFQSSQIFIIHDLPNPLKDIYKTSIDVNLLFAFSNDNDDASDNEGNCHQ